MNLERMSDLSKWKAEMLARCGGFSVKYIASVVHGVDLESVSDEQKSQIRSHLSYKKIKLFDWRDGRTAAAQAHAKRVAKPLAQTRAAIKRFAARRRKAG